MRIDNIINNQSDDFRIIRERCSQFICESNGQCLLKNLPRTYDNIHKVKVRKRKQKKSDPSEKFSATFNEAFEDELRGLRERAIFANGKLSFESADSDELDSFFIFPIDGYRFMYSSEVENSSQDYKTVFDAIFEEFGSTHGNSVITDLLKFTYTSDKLCEGIESGSEIIIYNIPYFYAVRTDVVSDYNTLLDQLKGHLDND